MQHILDTNKSERLERFESMYQELHLNLTNLFQPILEKFQLYSRRKESELENQYTNALKSASGAVLEFPQIILEAYWTYVNDCFDLLKNKIDRNQLPILQSSVVEKVSFHNLRLLFFDRMVKILKVLKGFHDIRVSLPNSQQESIWKNIGNAPESLNFEKLLLAEVNQPLQQQPVFKTESSGIANANAVEDGSSSALLPPPPPLTEQQLSVKEIFGEDFAASYAELGQVKDDVLSIVRLLNKTGKK
jgi:hypothetical protein